MQTIQSGPLNTLNVDAVADITKLLQLLPDQNTRNNLKSQLYSYIAARTKRAHAAIAAPTASLYL